eukprot:jgi/Hompol1/2394/HPOL_005980-RA
MNSSKTGWEPKKHVRKDDDGLENVEDYFSSDDETGGNAGFAEFEPEYIGASVLYLPPAKLGAMSECCIC